ncbi:MAG: AbrB/MazE/SpoVT family DNA-binding domain-containing protein [Archangium sp.]
MQTAKVFQSGNSQAVRLPREFRFKESELVIKRLGHAVVLLPRKHSAKALRALLAELGPVELEREQPEREERRP